MSESSPFSSQLHAGYGHKTLQQWQSGLPLAKGALVFPLFIVDDASAKQPIVSMPGQFRWGVDRLQVG